MQRHIVGKHGMLKPGQMQAFRFGRRRVVVIRTEDGYYRAIADSCPHQGASLSNGKLERMWVSDEVGQSRPADDQMVVVCPWHNFEFDVDTGRSPCEPDRLRVQTYRTELEGDDVVLYL